MVASGIAVVTGANQGIGYHIARLIATKGYKTYLACRREKEGQRVAQELRDAGLDTHFVQLDINDQASINKFRKEMEKEPKCDILVNNAATAFKASDPTPFDKQARPTIEVNYFGTFHVIKAMEPLMRKAEHPRIVTVASQAGLLKTLRTEELRDQFENKDGSLTVEKLGQAMENYVTEAEAKGGDNPMSKSNYGMSKCGVIALVKLLAAEEKQRAPTDGSASIFYTCFCPGYCSTSMSSHIGPRSAEKGAETGVWLATKDFSWEDAGGFYNDLEKLSWRSQSFK